ncbi:general stress protein [Mycetocola tolaasinivorans]|uniref:general stress protein n=1 Tax=Mycetocola tolaasinivorans TaxID=76635 RepID=UPI001FECC395|nr:general stress protein [Mycetocola tolaasinivorans]
MSIPQSGPGRNPFDAQLPAGETVAVFESYLDAQKAVAVLGQGDFPVRAVSIVGDDLRSVERVTGKMTYGRAAGSGALSGGWMGIFLGLILVIMNPTLNLGIVAAAVLLGAGFGMLFSIFTYSVRRRRKDFTSVMQIVAGSYSLIVPAELVGGARRLLSEALENREG